MTILSNVYQKVLVFLRFYKKCCEKHFESAQREINRHILRPLILDCIFQMLSNTLPIEIIDFICFPEAGHPFDETEKAVDVERPLGTHAYQNFYLIITFATDV